MNIENSNRLATKAESREAVKSPQVSRLRKWFNNTVMAVMYVAGAVTGAAVVTSNAGCRFDTSGVPMAPRDGGADAGDAGGDAGPDPDAVADAGEDSGIDSGVLDATADSSVDSGADAEADAQIPVEICDNGIDDDGDGLVDCADPDCEGEIGPGGGTCSVTEDCADGFDNNGNGDLDCADAQCNNSPLCGESCNNGVDDDGDGQVDCADSECDNFTDGFITCAYGTKWEVGCFNGLNDDGKNGADCADPICLVTPTCGGGVENCTDGVDNDGDGFIDCEDGACTLDPVCTVWTDLGGSTAGDACAIWDQNPPCNVGKTSQVTKRCVPPPNQGCTPNH